MPFLPLSWCSLALFCPNSFLLLRSCCSLALPNFPTQNSKSSKFSTTVCHHCPFSFPRQLKTWSDHKSMEGDTFQLHFKILMGSAIGKVRWKWDRQSASATATETWLHEQKPALKSSTVVPRYESVRKKERFANVDVAKITLKQSRNRIFSSLTPINCLY